MRWLTNNCTDACYNMAFDEFALESLPLDAPVFYLWRNAPSVIIGLNQNPYAEVNLLYMKDQGISLARRVTGGGAVYHDLQNLNYTIVGRSADLNAGYPGYLHYMVDALRRLGAPVELTGRNDIMVDGRKCSGYAKRVWKDRLMVHGTLMFNVDLEKLLRALSVPGSKMSASGVASVRSKVANLKDYLPGIGSVEELQAALHAILADGDAELELDASQRAAIESLADEKFRNWDWIYGRSPMAQFGTQGKYPCGTVELSWSVSHGHLEGVRFGGDFLGNLPASRVETLLEGVRFERSAILAALQKESGAVKDCFDGLAPEDIAELFWRD